MKNTYSERRDKLGSMLPKNSAVVIAGASTQYRNADSSHAFRQDSNFWYLTGFNEQKGIIDAYIKKEREWKKHKLVQANEIKKLEKVNTKLAKIIKSHEQ